MVSGALLNPLAAARPNATGRPCRAAVWLRRLVVAATLVSGLSAAPVSRDTARRAAVGWLLRNPAPMEASTGHAGDLMTCADESGAALFHVLELAPAGFVVVAADDELEPVLAFSGRSSFAAEPGTPLFDILKQDTRVRLAAVRRGGQLATRSAGPKPSAVRARWNELLGADGDSAKDVQARGVADVSDVCVAPMVKSRWDQVSALLSPATPNTRPKELYIYNFFTPPYSPGTPYNYPAGCAPVAWAQIMRFHRWPEKIRGGEYQIGIDGWWYRATMMGSDGAGGPYDWDNMPLEPDATTTPEQIVALGALMYDAGVGTGAHYTYMGTYSSTTTDEIKHVFQYAEAKTCYPRPGLSELMQALRTSLDAGLPANVDIFTAGGIGHSIVIDGYGYNAGTRYHHMNLGWSGHSDAWYNFPPVDVVMGDGSPEFFTIITELKYNIDPLIAGEMITGRITDGEGRPVGGATVTVSTDPVRSAVSNDRGIYAIKGLAAKTTYIVTARGDGYLFPTNQATVTTGDSAVETETTPNRIVDFRANAVAVAVANPQGSRAGTSIQLSVAADGAQPIAWQRNGVPLANTPDLSLTLFDLQPVYAGLYALTLARGSETIESGLAIVGLSSTEKIVGRGDEVLKNVFVASTGYTYDQILLEGTAASITADAGQITRMSYIDLDNDIVQVEFSGPGTLTLTLDESSGPALPLYYTQDVRYMKGHASIVVTGATQDTHLSVFSVGRTNAARQELFKPGVNYDGIADLAFIAISSRDGKFGGLRAANANFFASRGVTGVYAPGVVFTGPLFLGNVTAFDVAKPMIWVGGATDVRITGGDLYQDNGFAVQVSGLTHVAFRDGSDSHGRPILAKPNRALLRDQGTDVTASLVEAPAGSAAQSVAPAR